MPKWTEYTSKDTLADNDEVMLYDATARANKRGLMSKFWDYVVDKMATAVISKLQTSNKTIIGAINALDGNKLSRLESVSVPILSSKTVPCLNCLVLIVANSGGAYNLYACIGYRSDSVRSSITLLAGKGPHTITYVGEGTDDASNGIFSIYNGNKNSVATVYRIRFE